MNVKQSLLSKGLSGPSTPPVSQSGRDSDDKKSDDTKVVSLASSSPTLSLNAKDIQDALVSELLGTSLETNRYYDGTLTSYTVADVSTAAGSAVTVNAIAQGTGWTQRLGDSVRNRRLRLRIHCRQTIQSSTDGSGIVGTEAYSNATRIIVFRDKMPVIGTPCYIDANSWNLGATAPFSVNAIYTNPRATFSSGTTANPGQLLLATRNPQTLNRYHVYHDRIYNFADKYNAGGGSGTYVYPQASEWVDLDIDLHGAKTLWYDQANNNAFFDGRFGFLVISDAATSASIYFKWMSEIEFENLA